MVRQCHCRVILARVLGAVAIQTDALDNVARVADVERIVLKDCQKLKLKAKLTSSVGFLLRATKPMTAISKMAIAAIRIINHNGIPAAPG